MNASLFTFVEGAGFYVVDECFQPRLNVQNVLLCRTRPDSTSGREASFLRSNARRKWPTTRLRKIPKNSPVMFQGLETVAFRSSNVWKNLSSTQRRRDRSAAKLFMVNHDEPFDRTMGNKTIFQNRYRNKRSSFAILSVFLRLCVKVYGQNESV